jgi:hypothetical protein
VHLVSVSGNQLQPIKRYGITPFVRRGRHDAFALPQGRGHHCERMQQKHR